MQFGDCAGRFLGGGAEAKSGDYAERIPGYRVSSVRVNLRVMQSRAQLSYVLVFAVPLALVFLVDRIIPLNSGTTAAKITLLGLGAIYVGGFVLQQHYFPRLLQLRYVRLEIARLQLASMRRRTVTS
jgi:hypothetical protein